MEVRNVDAIGKSAREILSEELEYFERHREELLTRYKGKFVVVKGSKLIGHFATAEEAYEAAVTRFGEEPFLLKQVLAEEPPAQLPMLYTGIISARL